MSRPFLPIFATGPRAFPSRRIGAHLLLALSLLVPSLLAEGTDKSAPLNPVFSKDIQPILNQYCLDCHGDGAKKGGVAFDEFKSESEMIADHDLWLKTLKNVRAGIMPPPKKDQPTEKERALLDQWIKQAVFKADPTNPDPGRVTVRRLNRVEYRNTIRDLVGFEFDTDKEFPPDDSGHGFDNISDALTLSPMLLEKYLAAAKTIVSKAVPMTPRVPAEQLVPGKSFVGDVPSRTNRIGAGGAGLALSYYDSAKVTNYFEVKTAGRYQLVLDFTAAERFVDNQFDYNKCRFTFLVDGKSVYEKEYSREGNRAIKQEIDVEWKAGAHDLVLQVEPLTPDQKQVRSLTLRVDSLTARGPLEPEHWVRPKNYQRFFADGPPTQPEARKAYARNILSRFVEQAYRHPVEAATVERLVALAEATSQGKDYELGIAQAMTAVLASPRFLFREEAVDTSASSNGHPMVDEYALASRLSYLFWSSMPDEELFRLAREKKLRANLEQQTKRIMSDWKAEAFIRNFVGQWLQTRDVETAQIDARQVLARETPVDPEQDRRRKRFRELRDKEEASSVTPEERKEMDTLRATLFRGGGPRIEMTGDLRRAMRQETEKSVDYVIREDRSLLELLKSDYTFLNERLANHYGLTNLNVKGDEMRLVNLPAESVRGGVLTHGSTLLVTSNPTRTSPVKRGLFILDNLLGTPPPPPPPDIPPLEDAAKAMKEKTLTLRETLELHRQQPLCSSCHNRMDPLGLALENFNAMGMWRTQERSQAIDPSGKLLSGESFIDVRDLKDILVKNHATQFYHTVTEKLLTYALGRGLEYYDVAAVDAIVDRLTKANGRPSALIAGIVESAPFQRTRASDPERFNGKTKVVSREGK